MTEWLSYRPEDFILFSADAYYALFKNLNQELWPAHIVAIAGSIFIVAMFTCAKPGIRRTIYLFLAAAWFVCGWYFHQQYYQTLNVGAVYFYYAFALQSALLLIPVFYPASLSPNYSSLRNLTGMVLIYIALFAYPFILLLFGRPIFGVELAGIAPDPTVLVTIGLLLVSKGKLLWVLLPVPVLWILMSSTTQWVLLTS